MEPGAVTWDLNQSLLVTKLAAPSYDYDQGYRAIPGRRIVVWRAGLRDISGCRMDGLH